MLVATLAVAATAVALEGRPDGFKAIGGIVGTNVSALFLLVIAVVNFVIFIRIWRSFRSLRRGGRAGSCRRSSTGGTGTMSWQRTWLDHTTSVWRRSRDPVRGPQELARGAARERRISFREPAQQTSQGHARYWLSARGYDGGTVR